jgi:hypothetical protein
MPKTTTNYDNNHCYKIVCKDITIPDIYVGHTSSFTKRKHQHKKACTDTCHKEHNLFVYKFIRENGGWGNFDMILRNTHECENKREAEKVERTYIEDLRAALNKVLPRVQDTTKEYKTQWWQDNLERMREMKRYSYKYNKETIIAKCKDYYVNNKEKCQAWKNSQVECLCGSTYTKANRAIHDKSTNHQQYLEILK